MALAYSPPGVSVSEVVSPSINPLLATPASVCVVGRSQGYVQRTDIIALTNEDSVRLPNLPQNATLVDPVLSVSNLNAIGSAYEEDADYAVNYASAVNEVQTVVVSGASSGTFTLTLDNDTTDNIAYNAAISAVETALEALDALESADVTVSGSAGDYTITFSGQYANVNLSQLVADGSDLGGGSPSITVQTVTEGGVVGTINRIDSGEIAEGETVQVVYRYIPENYFRPTRVEDQSTVEDLYGPAFSEDGTLHSEVSFAAHCAFENGARDLVIQPLFRRTSPSDPESTPLAPSDTQVQDSVTWEHTLYGLRDIEDINVVVPVIGQSFPGLIDSELYTIFTKVQDHVRYMAGEQQYLIALFGEDSSASSSVAQRDTIRAHVQALRSRYGGAHSEQVIFLNTSKFARIHPSTSNKIYIGGQYVAASIAGMLASRAVSASLTREVISGFTEVADTRSKADKNRDASEGLCVIEQRGDVIHIRHSITTDVTSTARREVPVVRAKHRMIESVRDTLDTQIIGKVIADGSAPAIVAAAVGATLEQLKVVGDLVDYADIQARTLSLDPTTVEVRFSYKPAFPLNYIKIAFSIDLSGGETITTL